MRCEKKPLCKILSKLKGFEVGLFVSLAQWNPAPVLKQKKITKLITWNFNGAKGSVFIITYIY